ncbi:nickel-dependent hydrogenase large subunit [Methylomonas sp. AM2-LC]|uniref:nickel-dependent hydrogenase large subunit n=1 Tax=Methylomonas sp. AM2-LC TaxID=3153301 RepID=UPI0032646FF4
MTLAGAIHIELFHHAGDANGARIVSTRPDAARVLIGKTPEQLLSTLPMLFSLCGNTQAYASLLACRAAMGLDAEPEADAARELLVQLETLREHAWRIMLDWPGLFGQQQDKKSVAALLKFDALFKHCLFREGNAFNLDSRLDFDGKRLSVLINEVSALIDNAVFDGGMLKFQRQNSEEQLIEWLQQSKALSAHMLGNLYLLGLQAVGSNEVACLPTLDCQSLHLQLQQQDLQAFCLAPQWQGLCYESTPFGRQNWRPLIAELQSRYGNGLLVRFVALLQEVAAYVQKLSRFGESTMEPASSAYGFEGIGLAQVQAARGLLMHNLEFCQGRVYDYRIVAPTEWNFHPDGVVAKGLTSLHAADMDGLQRQAEWLINAVDPCVAYDLMLVDGMA